MKIGYVGPIPYYDILKFQAVVDGKEVGYTSFSIKGKELYIELVSAKKEYRGKGIAFNTFMLAIAYSSCDTIYTKGLSTSGRPFLENLEKKGLVKIIDDENTEVTRKGKLEANKMHQQLLKENESRYVTEFQEFLLESSLNEILKCNDKKTDITHNMKHIKTFESFLSETEPYYKGISKSTADKKKTQMNKQASMDDDDPAAYKEMPGDTKGKKTLKASKHTKKYHEIFGKDENYSWDEVDESYLLEADDDEKQSTDRSPLDNDAVETGLKNKSEETGVPIGILRAVFRRGMAAWKSGHRPGAGQEQWAYARTNSFLTKGKGTWGKADKDLAKEVRDGGHDSKL